MIASLIGMGISLLAGGWKAVQEHKLNKRRKAERDREYAKNQASVNAAYAKQYYENPLERSDNAALLNHMKQMQKEQTAQSEATAAITGATPESIQAQKNASAKAYAQTVSDIAANNQQHKDQVFNEWQQAKQDIRGELLKNREADYAQRAANIAKFGELGAQLGQNAAKAMATAPTKNTANADASKADVASGIKSLSSGDGSNTNSVVNGNSDEYLRVGNLKLKRRYPWQG